MTDRDRLRREMVRTGRRLQSRGYVVATEGNLSCRLGGDLFLVTPSGREKGALTASELLTVDLDGSPVGAVTARVSSEWGLHREFYRARPDVGAVCHAHPPFTTACAAARRPLRPEVLTETAALLGEVPLAAPAVPGTPEVAASVRDLVGASDAIVLANHGVVAVGPDLTLALHRLEMVERLAQVSLLAELAGGARPLPAELLARLAAAVPGPAASRDGEDASGRE